MSFYVETSFGSLNKYGEELCGDKVELLRSDDEIILVLSDGLGSGVKANILATLTSKIVITMLAEGAEIDDVVDTIATTLPVCQERKVAYSTFTILRVKTDGSATLIEYDNPETVLIRAGRPLYVEKKELHISGKTIQESHFQFQQGDVCVMFSDGAIHAGVGKLLNFGWQRENILEFLLKKCRKIANINARYLQTELLGACDDLYLQTPGDDTTVAACRICLPSIAHIMVGPPVHEVDDSRMVAQLLRTQGRKVVCGGTTSQIVSRVLGKELKVVFSYISPDVPPIGAIDGIDLVTEGVITLGKALEYIKLYMEGNKQILKDNDGACLLARLLIEDCTGAEFLVGRALNPAHQNPNLPIDLSLKLRLVEDIAAALRKLDKKVEVLYF